MKEQRYDMVGSILFRLVELKALDILVSPQLKSHETRVEITDLVRDNVKKVRVEVESNWSSRNYRSLNENITDLKLMEDKLKAYPDVFPSSWNNGIVGKIEREIEDLGQRARAYLRCEKDANDNVDDFRRCFIQMGFVLVELLSFKDFTKTIMCNVLESCLGSDWGYSFLFEFGLSLQRGDENGNEDDNRIVQIMITNFFPFQRSDDNGLEPRNFSKAC